MAEYQISPLARPGNLGQLAAAAPGKLKTPIDLDKVAAREMATAQMNEKQRVAAKKAKKEEMKKYDFAAQDLSGVPRRYIPTLMGEAQDIRKWVKDNLDEPDLYANYKTKVEDFSAILGSAKAVGADLTAYRDAELKEGKEYTYTPMGEDSVDAYESWTEDVSTSTPSDFANWANTPPGADEKVDMRAELSTLPGRFRLKEDFSVVDYVGDSFAAKIKGKEQYSQSFDGQTGKYIVTATESVSDARKKALPIFQEMYKEKARQLKGQGYETVEDFVDFANNFLIPESKRTNVTPEDDTDTDSGGGGYASASFSFVPIDLSDEHISVYKTTGKAPLSYKVDLIREKTGKDKTYSTKVNFKPDPNKDETISARIDEIVWIPGEGWKADYTYTDKVKGKDKWDQEILVSKDVTKTALIKGSLETAMKQLFKQDDIIGFFNSLKEKDMQKLKEKYGTPAKKPKAKTEFDPNSY